MGNLCCKSHEPPVATPQPRLSITSKSQIKVLANMFVQENQQSFHEIYKLNEKPLGSGAYGEVWLGTHKSSSEVRAVKILLKESISDEDIANRTVFEEVEILKNLDHPNILKVYEYFEDEAKYYIVMEFCKNGELFDLIVKKGCLGEKQAASIIKQLLSALAYLHGKGIIHRDIKPENLLISDNVSSDEIHVKLIDFNIATIKKAKLQAEGTLEYMAPEVFDGGYNEKCDVWGAGIVLYSVLTGSLPFGGVDDESIQKSIQKSKLSVEHENFSGKSKELKVFLAKLLEKNPKNRPSAQEALQDKWILNNTTNEFDNTPVFKTLLSIESTGKSSKLKEVISTFIVSQLSHKNTTRSLEKIFSSIDKNSDGVISETELVAALKVELGEQKAEIEVKKIMNCVNVDEAGNINYTEFLRISSDEKELLSKENIAKAFSFFDKDSSGSIDKSELSKWLSSGGIPEDIILELIEEADKDKDGSIDLKEFEEILAEKLDL